MPAWWLEMKHELVLAAGALALGALAAGADTPLKEAAQTRSPVPLVRKDCGRVRDWLADLLAPVWARSEDAPSVQLCERSRVAQAESR